MSNAKLKEQIEAAKIALVHSVESGTSIDMPQASNTVTQIPLPAAIMTKANVTARQKWHMHQPTPRLSIRGDDMASHDGGVLKWLVTKWCHKVTMRNWKHGFRSWKSRSETSNATYIHYCKNYVTSLPRVRPRPNQKKQRR